MPPDRPLPLPPGWTDEAEFVNSLLTFVTTNDLFRHLCGGVHILDFLTREPDLYSSVLPSTWRDWFEVIDVHELLDFLLREDLQQFHGDDQNAADAAEEGAEQPRWRGHPPPPVSLLTYVRSIRMHYLNRSFEPGAQHAESLPRHIAVGMKPKKIHEVANFAAYVDQLCSSVQQTDPHPLPLTIVDFGSGQNYLGRTLACPPYKKHVIAIEQRHHNVEGAKGMDVHAKLITKPKIMRNKKEYKRTLGLQNGKTGTTPARVETESSHATTPTIRPVPELAADASGLIGLLADSDKGSVTYIEHALDDGNIDQMVGPRPTQALPATATATTPPIPPGSLVVSIHSCGNLTHHGLRSLVLNESVRGVAMIGCCYNLLTERLGPATYKIPQLRSNHPRLEATSNAFDPHGFPMSNRLETFPHQVGLPDGNTQTETGVRLNITARMMAVQAPYNWGRSDSEEFFTRHFYRALLQKILLDRGVSKQVPRAEDVAIPGNSQSGRDEQGTPLIIGSLRKAAFTSFQSYVHAALEKLWRDQDDGPRIRASTADLAADTDTIRDYETRYASARKRLSVIWSLMAFSAGVVESTIVVDRWLWLTEQPQVKRAWVQAVFDYQQSPRNLVVVGLKRDIGDD